MTLEEKGMAFAEKIIRQNTLADDLSSPEKAVKFVAGVYQTGYKAAQQWICVKERLPEEDVDVAIGWFQKTASNKTFWTVDAAQLTNKVFSGWRVYPEVTHWMPLPAAPKDEV